MSDVEEQYIRKIGTGEILRYGTTSAGGLGEVPDGYELVIGPLPAGAVFASAPRTALQALADIGQELANEPEEVEDLYLSVFAEVIAFAQGGSKRLMRKALKRVDVPPEHEDLKRRILKLTEDDD